MPASKSSLPQDLLIFKMKTIEIISHSPQETIKLGTKIASHAAPGDIICLFGDMGGGKTTLVKGIAQGLKVDPNQVNSPTFVLFNIYEGKIPLYHFDLYRLEDRREILGLGYEEYFYGNGIAVVEWAQKLKNLMPEEYLSVEFHYSGQDQRLIKILGQGKRYEDLRRSGFSPRRTLIELPSSKQNSKTLAGRIDAGESFRVGKEKLNKDSGAKTPRHL